MTARLLDLTRLVSRVGQGPMTGVDRVEHAYLTHLLSVSAPVYGLVATGLGQVLLDRAGVSALADRLAGRVGWGGADLLSRLSRGNDPARRRAISDVRRLAVASARHGAAGRMLARVLPAGIRYLNTGHSNLSDAAFRAVQTVPEARIAVLVHDTIPLDHPDFTRPGQGDVFAAKLARVGAAADLVIYNSAQSRADAERHFRGWGRVPPGVVAHLGIDPPQDSAGPLPAVSDLPRPFFLCIGTIEPRKNHALLLDIWQDFAARLPPEQVPGLLIVGSRGWNNEAVFRRLDALPPGGAVRELPGVTDSALSVLWRQTAGLLFPSFAEGFGLPPAEAAARGVAALCNDLAVIREILGEYPVYAPVSDRYHWSKAVLKLADDHRAGRASDRVALCPALSTWAGHFNLVLKVT